MTGLAGWTEAGRTDAEIVAALRAGDEAAFAALVRQHHAAMLRLAATHVPSRAVAEEVVQETWLVVLEGIDRFRGDSSLRTWLFRILTNRAKTRGQRERRSIPFADLASPGDDSASSVDPDRFVPQGSRYAGHWTNPPNRWEGLPEDRLTSRETRVCIDDAIAELPLRQRAVISLRDVHGWTAAETCAILEISPANQRVLLHRARAVVRRALEAHLAEA
jgi:RNA polymerase sigma-70 factor, ECF subfamily